MKDRVIMARMAKRGADETSFDREFWRKVGHEARFAAMWDMVAEVNLIRGEHGQQPRLQRSVQNILRRAR